MNAEAKLQADRDDESIIGALGTGKSFLVEAGAGAGKTYSLMRVIDWLQDNKKEEYRRKKQKVVCITYTNAAVDVISGRLKDHSFIEPTTIHAFAWRAISQYQEVLVAKIRADEAYVVVDADMSKISGVTYDLGSRTIDDKNKIHLYHNDVISLFAWLLEKKKFRDIFSQRFPLILIDEYQDSFACIIDKFKECFISQKCGPQFGFFGDAWQTIYQTNNVCGEINDPNLQIIKKGANFRSAPKIVNLLNKIRPGLPQIAAINDIDGGGEVAIVSCDDFTGARRVDRNFRDDLPEVELSNRISALETKIQRLDPAGKDTIKTLLITHRMLATQQRYVDVLKALGNERFRNLEDSVLEFVIKQIEPAFYALKADDVVALSDVFGIRQYPIVCKQQKNKWKEFYVELVRARNQTILDVLLLIKSTNLLPIPPKVSEIIKRFQDNPHQEYQEATLEDYLGIAYNQFASAAQFFRPESIYSTDHGVKGEEYDNIIFGITKGWNQYDFPKYAPMIPTECYPVDKKDSYIRNRNLFYVCCSRPKKRLVIFISVPVSDDFKRFLIDLAGEECYYTYPDYINVLDERIRRISS